MTYEQRTRWNSKFVEYKLKILIINKLRDNTHNTSSVSQ